MARFAFVFAFDSDSVCIGLLKSVNILWDTTKYSYFCEKRLREVKINISFYIRGTYNKTKYMKISNVEKKIP